MQNPNASDKPDSSLEYSGYEGVCGEIGISWVSLSSKMEDMKLSEDATIKFDTGAE